MDTFPSFAKIQLENIILAAYVCIGVTACSKFNKLSAQNGTNDLHKICKPPTEYRLGKLAGGAWLLSKERPEKLLAEVYKGLLVFRQSGTSQRIFPKRFHAGRNIDHGIKLFIT